MRNGRFRMLLIYKVVIILIASSSLLFINALPPKPKDISCSICTNETCRMQVSFFERSMNLSADICNDFYNYACGNFMKGEVWTKDYPASSVFFQVRDKVSRELINDLRTLKDDEPMKAYKKLKTYFDNCLNENLIEEEDTRPFKELLHKVGGWPLIEEEWDEPNYSWEKTVSKISQEGFIPNFPFDVDIVVDPHDPTQQILKLDKSSIILSDNKHRNVYEKYVKDIALLLGAKDDGYLTIDLQQTINFEARIMSAVTPEERSRASVPKQMSIRNMTLLYPGINWLNYINSIISLSGVTAIEDDIIFIADQTFTQKMYEMLKITPKSILANLQMWLLLTEIIDYMPKRFDDKKTKYRNNIEDYRGRGPRDMECLDKLREQFPVALGSLYLKKHFDKSIVANIAEMVEEMKGQLTKTFEEADWMDEKTRQAAIKKAKNIGYTIGYPPEILEDNTVEEYYNDLELTPGSYFASFRNLSTFNNKIDYANIIVNGPNHRPLLRKSNKQSEWVRRSNVVMVNAYYQASKNMIYLPAALIQDPFYNPKRPNYLNYASLGSIIGHEISHGFDSRGRHYDFKGNISNWWEPDTDTKFIEKTQCFVDQFNNFIVPTLNNLQIQGEQTVSENLADNGGMGLAYRSYANWVKKNSKEKCLPLSNIDMFPQQTFWLMAGATWCATQSDMFLESLLKTEIHAPPEARVRLGFANIEEFSRDFSCPPGSPMNPAKRCKVW